MSESKVEVTYRVGTEEDWPVIARYYEKLDGFFRDRGLNLPKAKDTGQAFLDSFTRMHGRYAMVHVAEINGEVIGFILSRIKRVPEYWGGVMVGILSDMWIVEEARRHGIARQLSVLALDWLQENKVHSVEIQVLNLVDATWNLYGDMGFKPELRQARLMWDDYDTYKDARG